jgi:hypothetical protein
VVHETIGGLTELKLYGRAETFASRFEAQAADRLVHHPEPTLVAGDRPGADAGEPRPHHQEAPRACSPGSCRASSSRPWPSAGSSWWCCSRSRRQLPGEQALGARLRVGPGRSLEPAREGLRPAVELLFALSQGLDTAGLLPLLGLFAFAGYRMLPAFQNVFNALEQALGARLRVGPGRSLEPAREGLRPAVELELGQAADRRLAAPRADPRGRVRRALCRHLPGGAGAARPHRRPARAGASNRLAKVSARP